MRIQHNISALNAYNNYTANSKAMSNSLEKLSSGYKINKAADDAAGLAISEKMRAQIKGMETATDNANDGISLIQTAEGALTEVHSMLNRMVQLATQSANGTFDDATDRVNLQAEVNQLQEEIDRIAKSTNYNGINLLDGTQSGKAAQRATIEVGNLKNLMTSGNGGPLTIMRDGIQSSSGPKKMKFSVDLTNMKISATSGSITMMVGDAIFNVTGITNTVAVNGTTLADTFVQLANGKSNVELGKGTCTLDGGNGDGTVTIGDVNFKVRRDGAELIFEMQEYPTTEFKQDLSVSVAVTTDSGSITTESADVKSSFNQGNMIGVRLDQEAVVGKTTLAQASIALAELNGVGIVDGTTLKIGKDTYIFAVGKDSQFANATGGKVVDLTGLTQVQLDNKSTVATIAANALSMVAKNNSMFQVGTDNKGHVEITEKPGAIDYSEYNLTGTTNVAKDGKWGDLIQSGNGTVNQASEAQGGLTMQIGDTPDNFNKLTLVLDDMSSIKLGVGRIDISTQEGAAEAIDKIKAAINKVSTTRGTMGAMQNRLEYTINNLNAGVENMQSAESRIRDVDMAKEMTEYTKNNILLQASQAMLAQANQLPQGVLQLLQ